MSNNIQLESKKQFVKGIRRCYSANFKLMVIREAEAQNNSFAAKKFSVTECNIRRWRQQKNALQIAPSSRKSFRGPKKGQYEELDNQIAQYIDEMRSQGYPVTREVICMKAVEIAKNLKIPEGSFKASIGWCRRMMKRFDLSLRRRTTLAQKLPRDFEEKLLSFQRHIISLRKKYNYALHVICNADQTPVYFDMPTNVTVNKKGEKSVLIRTTGNEKSRITVMLAVLADGTKLPPYIIIKRKTMPKEHLPPGIIVRVQEKGWMDRNLVVDWIKTVWRKHLGLLSYRSMLILDAFKGHLTELVKEKVRKLNCDLVIIPGGMTSQLQVLDVVVNKPFKTYLKGNYTNWLLANDHELTPTGKIKKPSVALLCEWVIDAWSKIEARFIINGFKKCCVSNAMDGTEDDILWQEENTSDADSCEESDPEYVISDESANEDATEIFGD